jgi:hypothetical protein
MSRRLSTTADSPLLARCHFLLDAVRILLASNVRQRSEVPILSPDEQSAATAAFQRGETPMKFCQSLAPGAALVCGLCRGRGYLTDDVACPKCCPRSDISTLEGS